MTDCFDEVIQTFMEPCVWKVVDVDVVYAEGGKSSTRLSSSIETGRCPDPPTTEYYRAHLRAGVDQLCKRRAATELEVVGVCAER